MAQHIGPQQLASVTAQPNQGPTGLPFSSLTITCMSLASHAWLSTSPGFTKEFDGCTSSSSKCPFPSREPAYLPPLRMQRLPPSFCMVGYPTDQAIVLLPRRSSRLQPVFFSPATTTATTTPSPMKLQRLSRLHSLTFPMPAPTKPTKYGYRLTLHGWSLSTLIASLRLDHLTTSFLPISHHFKSAPTPEKRASSPEEGYNQLLSAARRDPLELMRPACFFFSPSEQQLQGSLSAL